MSFPARPNHAVPESYITSRVPRTRKYYLGTRRNVIYRVVEEPGNETEWVCNRAVVTDPDGNPDELTNITEIHDGVFSVSVLFAKLGIYEIAFFYGPEDASEALEYRVRIRVVK